MNEYQILKSIGVGSYGTVHLALHKQQKNHYVVKKLKMWGLKEQQKQKIDNQVKLLKDFQHINIVRYRDSFIDKQGFLNIVMTNCQGGDMYQLIQNLGGKKIQQKQIIDWAVQVALAIYYMHQKKILHRDLKTSNIFLNNNRVRLGDFGISKVLDQNNDFLAQTNIGTPLYMSPQQFKNKPYSYKSDIWAFGCVLYQMCNHKHAFTAQSLQGLARKIFLGQFSPVSDYYSPQLRQMIHKMLSQNPKGRPTIIQILQKPFMRRRVQNYIKQMIEQHKNDQQLINNLINQAKSLGIKVQLILSNDKGNQSTPRKSSASKTSKRESQQKLKKQRQRVRQQLQAKLKKQNEQKKKMQQKIKQIQKQRKEMQEAAKNKRKSSYQRVTSALSSRNSAGSSFTEKKQCNSTHAPSVSSNLSKNQQKVIKREQKIPIIINPKPIIKKQFSHIQQAKKSFQMKQQHDMHYQDEESDEQGQQFINAIIDQEVQEEEQIKKMVTQPNPIDESIKQEIIISNSYIKSSQIKQSKQVKQIKQVKEDKGSKIQKINQSIHQQQSIFKKASPQKPVVIKPQVDATRIKQIQELKKQVKQKTAQINLLQTQLQAIDFQFSSDSDNQPKFGQQKRDNPTYIRLKQRAQDLKHKILPKLGRDGYNKLMAFAHTKAGKQNQPSREQVSLVTGKYLVGLWHLAQNIVTLQNVAATIPAKF